MHATCSLIVAPFPRTRTENTERVKKTDRPKWTELFRVSWAMCPQKNGSPLRSILKKKERKKKSVHWIRCRAYHFTSHEKSFFSWTVSVNSWLEMVEISSRSVTYFPLLSQSRSITCSIFTFRVYYRVFFFDVVSNAVSTLWGRMSSKLSKIKLIILIHSQKQSFTFIIRTFYL